MEVILKGGADPPHGPLSGLDALARDALVEAMTQRDLQATNLLEKDMIEQVKILAQIIAKKARRPDLVGALFQDATESLKRRIHCRGRSREPMPCRDQDTGRPSYMAFSKYVFISVKSKFLTLVEKECKQRERETPLTDFNADEAERILEDAQERSTVVQEVLQKELLQLLDQGQESLPRLVSSIEAAKGRSLTSMEIRRLGRFIDGWQES